MLLVARGHSNKKIADTMGITEGTVKLHLSAAFKTLNVKNRTEAVFALSQLGFKESDTG
jgi:DNA-binding NarL/FixJ family response regulator